jgi:hypothetical protein
MVQILFGSVDKTRRRGNGRQFVDAHQGDRLSEDVEPVQARV